MIDFCRNPGHRFESDRFHTPVSVVFLLLTTMLFSSVLFLSRVNGQTIDQGSGDRPFRSRMSIRRTGAIEIKVQTEYPAIGKIVGRGKTIMQHQKQIQSVYYGSGVYAAEVLDYGIVLTNWHVVSESEASIQVLFGNFSSEGFVLLADEVWDLAAIVIRKPPFLPLPISLEVPQLGEELWVAGYGQYAGLNGFRIQSGKVIRYMTLVARENLPAETISIDAGVRQGDSGGPILNRYGELAGLLWGSDGTVTMGTFSLRLQAFLTQAQFQLINQSQITIGFFEHPENRPAIRKIEMASTPARTALQASGIFPISTRPVYTSAYSSAGSNGSVNALYPGNSRSVSASLSTVLPKPGNGRPPYPPMESPTLFAQRKAIGRNNPEVYPPEMLAQQREMAKISQSSNNEDVNTVTQTSVSLSGGTDRSIFREVSIQSDPSRHSSSARQGNRHDGELARLEGSTSNESEPSGSMVLIPDSGGEESGRNPVPGPSDGSTEENGLNELAFKFQLNDIQTILVVSLIFFLFFNAARFLAIAGEKKE